MYVVRRVYKVQPGTARKAATLLVKLGEAYEKVGQRQPSRVYFNGVELPGQPNRVYMEWITETIESPYRAGNVLSDEVRSLNRALLQLQEENWVEFYDLMTTEKMVPDEA